MLSLNLKLNGDINMLKISTLPQFIKNHPIYDRKAMVSRIVHLDSGAFHRAHQALFIDRLLNTGKSDWAICDSMTRCICMVRTDDF
jgi:hypothetical protein